MNRILMGVAALALAGASPSSADVLVMDDGRRIRGELVSVNRGTVLFDEIREGTTRKRRMRVDQDEVARIVLRDDADGDEDDLDARDGGPFGGGRDRYPDDDDRQSRDDRDRRAGRDPNRDRDLDPDPVDDGPFGRRDDERSVERPDSGSDRPLSARDRVVTVSSQQAWTDTGIDLKAGDVVRFMAEGNVVRGPGQEDGAAGEMNSPINNRRPVPARPAGALIGRIGTSAGDVFFIGGDRGAFRVRTAGRLYLGVNDHYYVDNSGTFEVRVIR